MQRVYRLIATVFFIGDIPVAQGTLGSIAGAGLFILIHSSTSFLIPAVILLFFLGIVSIRGLGNQFKEDDRRIVIDEVCGMLTALLFIPFRWPYIALSFMLFRAFDIFKPFPIRRSERLPSPWGVMLDDILAGLYANVAVRLAGTLFIDWGHFSGK